MGRRTASRRESRAARATTSSGAAGRACAAQTSNFGACARSCGSHAGRLVFLNRAPAMGSPGRIWISMLGVERFPQQRHCDAGVAWRRAQSSAVCGIASGDVAPILARAAYRGRAPAANSRRRRNCGARGPLQNEGRPSHVLPPHLRSNWPRHRSADLHNAGKRAGFGSPRLRRDSQRRGIRAGGGKLRAAPLAPARFGNPYFLSYQANVTPVARSNGSTPPIRLAGQSLDTSAQIWEHQPGLMCPDFPVGPASRWILALGDNCAGPRCDPFAAPKRAP